MKVFLDIEGTGTQNNQIAQLAYIKTDDDQNVVTAKNFFFKIDDMNPFAQRLHGLSMEYLRRASDGEIFKDRFE
ncbi:MAG: exonuclease domain-containing protein, partial [Bacillota bacterium]|nr:exonuclease domain-containing protein [Bacillota bacterium]